MPSVRTLFIPGPAGRLEAVLNEAAAAVTHVALITHPHPLHGGTLHNKVVFHAMKALNGIGLPVLRLNFRGTGLSEGQHDYGRGEVDDVHAALQWLTREFRLPILFAGFSFGAAVGLRAACAVPCVAALIALGLPLEVEDRVYSYEFLAGCPKPKLFISGAHDQYAERNRLQQVIASAADPKASVFIEEGDHFFEGKLDQVREAIVTWWHDTTTAASA
jgi:alpha/beta superfamily hydrolase